MRPEGTAGKDGALDALPVAPWGPAKHASRQAGAGLPLQTVENEFSVP